MTRGRAVAARQAHNLEVAGSSPAPATEKTSRKGVFFLGAGFPLQGTGESSLGNL